LIHFHVRQVSKTTRRSGCNTLSKTVAESAGRYPAPITPGLRCRGQRKYLTHAERELIGQASLALKPQHALIVGLLLWTGARISEILSLRAADFDLSEGLVVVRTLKRRCPHMREIPLPQHLLAMLEDAYALTALQADPDRSQDRLFAISRATAWRIIKRLCCGLKIRGSAASPKGFRHSFGVATLQAGVPLTLVQRWLGHARLSTTAIYTEVIGAEERAFAKRFWSWRPNASGPSNRGLQDHGLSDQRESR
jgi:integrase/recombinase XerD